MLELGSSGSARGVSSNGHPYRDPRPLAVTHGEAASRLDCDTAHNCFGLFGFTVR